MTEGTRTEALWRERPVFVTGATGMVGSWLVKDLLSRGANVIALVRDADPQSEIFRSGDVRRVNVVSGCLEDFWTIERALNEYNVETVFHLGASPIVGVAHRFPLPTLETNIRGTYNLLEACRVHQTFVKRIIIASSDKAYGEQPALPYTEDMPLLGRHPYEVSKVCADLLAQAYAHTYGLPVAIARCGNIYGGGDLNWSRIVPGTVRSLVVGERPVVRSDGTYVRDYLYVKDVVAAYLALAEHLDDASVRGEAFNFSPEQPRTVKEIVQVIQRLMGAEHLAPDIQNAAQGEIHSQYLSAAKARAVLQWSPKHSLEEGLKEAIAWYIEFLSRLGEPALAGETARAAADLGRP